MGGDKEDKIVFCGSSSSTNLVFYTQSTSAVISGQSVFVDCKR